MDYEEEEKKPSKEEQERQKIEKIINQTVGEDITNLSEQITEFSNILAPMYEVILDIQNSIKSQENEKISEQQTENNNVD
jgi:hypothetical protein